MPKQKVVKKDKRIKKDLNSNDKLSYIIRLGSGLFKRTIKRQKTSEIESFDDEEKSTHKGAGKTNFTLLCNLL